MKTSSRPSPSKSSTRHPPAIDSPLYVQPDAGRHVHHPSRGSSLRSRRTGPAAEGIRAERRRILAQRHIRDVQQPLDPQVFGPLSQVAREVLDRLARAGGAGDGRPRRPGGRYNSTRCNKPRSSRSHPASARRRRAARPGSPGEARVGPVAACAAAKCSLPHPTSRRTSSVHQ